MPKFKNEWEFAAGAVEFMRGKGGAPHVVLDAIAKGMGGPTILVIDRMGGNTYNFTHDHDEGEMEFCGTSDFMANEMAATMQLLEWTKQKANGSNVARFYVFTPYKEDDESIVFLVDEADVGDIVNFFSDGKIRVA